MSGSGSRLSGAWRTRIAMAVLIAVGAVLVWWTNLFLTERFTETTRSRAEVRLALYSGNILSELQRNQIVPQLLARDPTLIGALNSGDFSQSSQRLIEYRDEIAAEGMLLMDKEGRAVAATASRRFSSRRTRTTSTLQGSFPIRHIPPMCITRSKWRWL